MAAEYRTVVRLEDEMNAVEGEVGKESCSFGCLFRRRPKPQRRVSGPCTCCGMTSLNLLPLLHLSLLHSLIVSFIKRATWLTIRWILMSTRSPSPSPPAPPIPGSCQNLEAPSLLWRAACFQTLFGVATLCRGFLYGLNKTEVHGLPQFLELLKARAHPAARKRGLLTVSNHVSVMDDPLIWGVLPFTFHGYHSWMNHRWGFGSHDICYKAPIRSHFFTLGQVLPTHRAVHSPHGGPYQPTMLEAIRVLSRIRTDKPTFNPYLRNAPLGSTTVETGWPHDCVDPFSDLSPAPYYPASPFSERNFLPPSRYVCNTHGWVHIFPEGMIHQTPTYNMRYFKWGLARLILEPDVCPDVVPMWIEGTDQIMHESRTFPRFLPRALRSVSVTFGDPVDTDVRFGDLRKRWQVLKDQAIKSEAKATAKSQGKTIDEAVDYDEDAMRGIMPPSLIDSPKVQELWIETALRVREEVLKLRRARGWPDEDPKASAAATWAREGPKLKGRMEDGSWVGET